VPVDGRLESLPVVLELELVRHDDRVRQESGTEHVERPVDRVPARAARSPGDPWASTVLSMEPTNAASLYQIGVRVDLADPGRPE